MTQRRLRFVFMGLILHTLLAPVWATPDRPLELRCRDEIDRLIKEKGPLEAQGKTVKSLSECSELVKKIESLFIETETTQACQGFLFKTFPKDLAFLAPPHPREFESIFLKLHIHFKASLEKDCIRRFQINEK